MTDPDFVVPFSRLPERFAESIENPPAVPVRPRPAATIALLRDGSDGPEVLLLRRNRSAGFVPGAYVFPGGRVDASDAASEIVARMHGLDGPAAARRLQLHDGDPPALAYYLAAVREAFEETGILVGLGPHGTPPPTAAADSTVDELRDDLMEDRTGFADVLDRMECRIDGDALEYFAHWITPEVEPRRFDTRFFAAKVGADADTIVDPREMSDAVWLTPAAALARYDDGSLPMVFPTIKTLEQFEAYATVDEALTDMRQTTVPTILPRLVITPTGVGMELDE
jgi:8-oxo-dGTP pyrophosphatase MutT (NUDIX family)